MDTTPNTNGSYGPCSTAVRAVLGRASGLSAPEIVGLAHARDLFIEGESWNTAIDTLSCMASACGRQDETGQAADEAARLTWLAATTATNLPDLARSHLVSHGPAFGAATAAAAKIASVAAMSAVMADRLDPETHRILSAPWQTIIETAPSSGGHLI